VSNDISFVTHVTGVREVFRELRKFEPKLVHKSQAMMRTAARPIVVEAQRLIRQGAASSEYIGGGGNAPLSGWGAGGRLGWQTGKVAKGVSIKAGSAYDKGRHQWQLIRVVQSSPAGMLYDWAGRSGKNIGARGNPIRGRAFVDNLPKFGYVRGSKHSRTIFPAIVATRRVVADEFVQVMGKVAEEIQKRIS
jgi:hypothetical protein